MIDSHSDDYVHNQAIVGFANDQYIRNARNILIRCSGFIKILKEYNSISSVLVEIQFGFLQKFISEANQVVGVEFCNKNYYLSLASYEDLIHKDFQENRYTNSDIYKIHAIQRNSDRNGIGLRVALIDTGMNCHPCLPATSFKELQLRNYKNSLDKKIYDNFINNTTGIENAYGYLSSNKTHNDSFIHEIENEIAILHSTVWNDWSTKTYQNSVVAPTSSFKQPIFHNVLGYFRKTSIYSYNFVDDNLDIRDKHGHGTSMAGVFCGEHPSEIKNSLFNGSELLGLLPYAEYISLKIYDTEKNKSTINLLMGALDYCCNLDISIDLIYCGLVSDSAPASEAIAINKLIDQLYKKGTIFVCPAGNNAKGKLSMPANISSSIAVTSIQEIAKNLRFSDESNHADTKLSEKIDFCAIGGSSDKKIPSTSINFGYSKSHGTSIAAAITASIIGRHLSESYMHKMNTDFYPTMRSACMQNMPLPTYTSKDLQKNPISHPHDFINELKSQTTSKYNLDSRLTTAYIGSGYIKDSPTVLSKHIW